MTRPLGRDGKPVRSHRRYDLSTRQRIGAGALILVALTIGGFAASHQPSIDQQQEPYLRAGSVGHLVDVRTFDATVLGVRGAAVIRQDDLNHDTSGVWILVKVKLAARTDPTTVKYAVLRDSQGSIYRPTSRVAQPLVDGTRTLEPGIPLTGEIAYEVPVGATGLTFRLAENSIDDRMDAMADVKLPIGSGTLRQWKSQTQAVALADTELAG
jgi:hypothetical protein